MSTTVCPPMAIRVTKSLLGYGVIAGPIYVVVAAGQALTREGFDPTRHAVSEFENGYLGWIQIANFLVTGAMTIAAAVGVRRALGSVRAAAWAGWLIGGYGAGLLAAGVFLADPSSGFPPGAPAGVTWHGMAHLASAGAGFACLVAACFVLAAQFAGNGEHGWAIYSRTTATVFAASVLALASGAGGAVVLIVFAAAVIATWAWLTAISVKLYRAVS